MGSLLTGELPTVHGIMTGPKIVADGDGPSLRVQDGLHSEVPTLAEALQNEGYATAAVVSNVFVGSKFGFDRGFEHFDDPDRCLVVTGPKCRADTANERVRQWFATEPAEPWFLMVHYMEPHWPYDPPAPHGEAWTADYEGPLDPSGTGHLVENLGQPLALSEEDRAYVIGLYDGEIAAVDTGIDRCCSTLSSDRQRGPW